MKKTWVVIPSLIEIRIMLSNNMQKGEYDSLHRKRSISTDSSSCWISRICEKRLISRVERTWQMEMTEEFWQGWHISHRRDCPHPFCDDTCPGLCSFHNTQSFRGKPPNCWQTEVIESGSSRPFRVSRLKAPPNRSEINFSSFQNKTAWQAFAITWQQEQSDSKHAIF